MKVAKLYRFNDHAQGRGSTKARMKKKNGYSRVAWMNLFASDLYFMVLFRL